MTGEYNTTTQARTARVKRWCSKDEAPILPGDRYLRHVAFPGHDANSTGKPWVLIECVPCAVRGEREYETGACLFYCCGIEPCARSERHDGDHRCQRCPEFRPAEREAVPS